MEQKDAVTIYDIAKLCGVSPGTVSKALNDYKGVNPETKSRIIAIAREMDFQPNSMARYLNTKRSFMLGVLIYLGNNMPGLKQSFFLDILESFKSQFEQNRYDIIILSKNLKGTHGSFLNHCKRRKTDGVLIFGDYTNESIAELLESDMPTVGFDYAGNKISGVSSDNYSAMRELVGYVISLGHKNIVFMHGEHNPITERRKQAFKDEIEKAGISMTCRMTEGKYYNVEFAREETQRLMNSPSPPTAILYPDDVTAIAGMQKALSMGVSVPGELSVAGFDGTDITDLVYPTITTVKQNSAEIGKALAECLIESMDGAPARSVQIKAELKIGGSTGKP